MTSCRSSTQFESRCCTSVERARGTVPCKESPTAKRRWMTWSWRSRAIRSRSVRTSSSRIRRCEVASCQARVAWSAKAAIMSSCSTSERVSAGIAEGDKDTGDGVGGPQWQHERGASFDAQAKIDIIDLCAECDPKMLARSACRPPVSTFRGFDRVSHRRSPPRSAHRRRTRVRRCRAESPPAWLLRPST